MLAMNVRALLFWRPSNSLADPCPCPTWQAMELCLIENKQVCKKKRQQSYTRAACSASMQACETHNDCVEICKSLRAVTLRLRRCPCCAALKPTGTGTQVIHGSLQASYATGQCVIIFDADSLSRAHAHGHGPPSLTDSFATGQRMIMAHTHDHGQRLMVNAQACHSPRSWSWPSPMPAMGHVEHDPVLGRGGEVGHGQVHGRLQEVASGRSLA